MIDLYGLIAATSIGLIIGILVGIVPGLGVSSTFLIISPFLASVHPVYGLFLFVSILTASQYFGSIVSLIYGVPGEVSSYPVIAERSNLLNSIDATLKQTAIGSFVASMAVMWCFVALMSLGNFWIYLYNYRVFAWVLLLAVTATVLFGSKDNTKWANLFLFVAGFFIARIGFNKDTGTAWGTFSIPDLYTGISLPAVALGLLVLPTLVKAFSVNNIPIDSSASVKDRSIAWPSISRGTFLGLIGGLVPGVTYMASTQISYFVENWINKTQKDRPLKAVVSTSTADNAGASSSLYPLLWLGIPISLGEAMVVWLFDKKGIPLNLSTISQPVNGVELFWFLIFSYVVVNAICYILSWPAKSVSIKLAQYSLHQNTRYFIIAATLVGTILLSLEALSPIIFWITVVVSFALGVVFKKIDWMPLIIGLILQDSIELTLLKLGVLSI